MNMNGTTVNNQNSNNNHNLQSITQEENQQPVPSAVLPTNININNTNANTNMNLNGITRMDMEVPTFPTINHTSNSANNSPSNSTNDSDNTTLLNKIPISTMPTVTVPTMGFEDNLNQIMNLSTQSQSVHNENDSSVMSASNSSSSNYLHYKNDTTDAVTAQSQPQPCSSTRSGDTADPLTGAEMTNVMTNTTTKKTDDSGQSLSLYPLSNISGMDDPPSVRWPNSTVAISSSNPVAVFEKSCSIISPSRVNLSTHAHDHKSISTINYPEPESIELEFKPLPLPLSSLLPASQNSVQSPVKKSLDEDVDLLDFDSSLGPSVVNNGEDCASSSTSDPLHKIHVHDGPTNSSKSFSDSYSNNLNSSAASSSVSKSSSSPKKMDDSFLDFELNCSSKEIAKVLETFNAILDHEEKMSVNDLNLNLNFNPSHSECVQMVDNFTNLLIGGEDEEDLLIVVDDNDSKTNSKTKSSLETLQDFHRKLKKENSLAQSVCSVGTSASNHSLAVGSVCGGDGGQDASGHESTEENEDQENEDEYDRESNYPDYPDGGEDIEGYESDRPMVRASMRKLRPVQMLPMPSSSSSQHHNHSSYTIPENPSPSPPGPGAGTGIGPSPPAGLATTLSSPITNRILVTSLINSLRQDSNENTNSGDSHRSNFLGGPDLLHCSVINEVSNPMYGEVGQSSSAHGLGMISVAALGSSSSSSNMTGRSEGPDAVASVATGTSNHNSNPVTNPNGSSATTIISSASSGLSSSNSPSNNNVDSVSSNNGSSTDPTNPSNGSAAESTSNNNNGNSGTAAESTSGGTTTATSTSRTGTGVTTGTGTGTERTSALLGPGLRMPAGKWPHRLSSVLALIGCTLGLNNICRFSLLSVEYGANFILQFLFLSLVFGIPLFTFHMSIGQYLSSGIIDMWRISPIFQGIGIGLVVSQALIGIYTAVGVSWVFIYFRDSFITRYDQYRWGKCFRDYRDTACDSFSPLSNITNFSQSVPDYFNGVVLQRGSPSYPSSSTGSSSLKFTVAFNLAVVWMLVFVSLSKGLKSYGKVVHGFVLIPVASLLVLASKMVGLVPSDQTSSLFGQTAWSNFFFNSQTWVVAAREAFFTWGLLGACVMQVTSHNRFTHRLKSDASIVVLITTFVLLLSAFLGNACYSVILAHGYTYSPSSFESDKTYTFLTKTPSGVQSSSPESAAQEPYINQHVSFLMGVRILKPEAGVGGDGSYVSGYQALRLATELFPTTMAMLGHTGLSPFWTVLFYFTFILFGIAQQIAIWHCVIRGVIAIKSKVLRSWEITITFCVCATGFVLGLPLCTELGIFIEYFLDYAIGSGWWIMVLYLLELVAVFIVRGAPYCGENIVTVLMTGRGRLVLILAPLLSFVWNVILPVAMLVLTIASFKSGNVRELYDWNPNHGYGFWPSWTKELGSLIQLLPILAVPLVAIVQSCRYLSTGPPDLFDRMQQLYRPNSRGLFGRSLSAHLSGNTPATDYPTPDADTAGASVDPPPKYTPPPSYSTATGAKIAKFLRNSIRRSMRRLGAVPSTSNGNSDLPPPPNYASVILEISAQQQQQLHTQIQQQLQQQQNHHQRQQHLTLSPSLSLNGEMSGHGNVKYNNANKIYQVPLSQTLGRSLGESKERASLRRIASDITPRDIARILRTSFRRSSNNSSDRDVDSTDDHSAINQVQIFTTANSAHQNAAVPSRSMLSTFQNNLNYNNITSLHLTGHPIPAPMEPPPPPPTATFHLESDLEFLRVPIVPPSASLSGRGQKTEGNTNMSSSSGAGNGIGLLSMTSNSDVTYNVNNNGRNSSTSTNNVSIIPNTNNNSATLTLPNPQQNNLNLSNPTFNNSSSNNNCNIYSNPSSQSQSLSLSHSEDREKFSFVNPVSHSQSHTRSRSSGGSLFMAGQSHNRGRSDTTDSQLTLISHSSSQNDLSNLVYNQNLDSSVSLTPTPMDFRLGGIVNPGFQFSHVSLPRGSGINSSSSCATHMDDTRQPASSSEA